MVLSKVWLIGGGGYLRIHSIYLINYIYSCPPLSSQLDIFFQHHSTNLTLFPMGYKLWEGGNCVYVFHQGHVLLIICATIFVLFSLSLHSKSNCSFRRGKKRGQNDQFRPSPPPPGSPPVGGKWSQMTFYSTEYTMLS